MWKRPETSQFHTAITVDLSTCIMPVSMSMNVQTRKTALREAKILRQLQHPNVVRLQEVFRSKTKLYMIFEYVDRSILQLLVRHATRLIFLCWQYWSISVVSPVCADARIARASVASNIAPCMDTVPMVHI